MGRFGPSAKTEVPTPIPLLDNEYVAEKAAKARRDRTHAKSAVPAIVNLLKKKPKLQFGGGMTKTALANALGQIGPEAKQLCLRRRSSWLRKKTRKLEWRRPWRWPASIQAQGRAWRSLLYLHDDFEYARRDAAEVLGNLGPAAAPAIPQLIAAVKKRDYAATKILGQTGPQAARRLTRSSR